MNYSDEVCPNNDYKKSNDLPKNLCSTESEIDSSYVYTSVCRSQICYIHISR